MPPTGWDAVEQEAAMRAQRQAEFDANRKPELWMAHVKNAPGGFVIARFLEQGPDVHAYPTHDYKVPVGGSTQTRRFWCLNPEGNNTPCPGCQAGLKRKTRAVFNIIHRDRAVLRRGSDGKAIKDGAGNYIIDGHRDEVVIFDVPSTTSEVLRKKDVDYKGLMTGEVKIAPSGETFQPWSIEPADINNWAEPMSEADVELAKGKHNLDEYAKPPEFAEAARIVTQYGGNSGASQTQQQAPAGQPQVDPANPFMPGGNQPQQG